MNREKLALLVEHLNEIETNLAEAIEKINAERVQVARAMVALTTLLSTGDFDEGILDSLIGGAG